MTIQDTIEQLARQFMARPDVSTLDYDEDDQVKHVLENLAKFTETTPLWPVEGRMVNLSGYGRTPIVAKAAKGDDEYVSLAATADALGWPHHLAYAWAEKQRDHTIRDQRECDEERGDGRLGWECLRDYFDLGLWLTVDDPAAKPDAGGSRWSYTGEFLVSTDRLVVMLMDSPWGKEFMDGAQDLMRHAFKDTFGGGQAMPGMEPELSLDEAIRKAKRGPALDNPDGAR